MIGLEAAATAALLEQADKIRVDAYIDHYINPWGPNGNEVDFHVGDYITYDDNNPTYQNMTVKEFIEKESI